VDTIVWVKKGSEKLLRGNIGYHVRHAHEICILALKGNIPDEANLRKKWNVIFEKPRFHSQKPDALYEIGMALCPKGPRLDLFARYCNLQHGIVSAGNEISEEAWSKALERGRIKSRGKRRARTDRIEMLEAELLRDVELQD
jgi:mRNA m6A methyltransferase catalytic subunit